MIIEKNCLFCKQIIYVSSNKALKYQKKFCNKNCSASHNNKVRELNKSEWKAKISKRLKQRFIEKGPWGAARTASPLLLKKCLICNNNFFSKTRKINCSENCFKKYKQLHPPPKTPGGYRKGSGRGKHGWYDNIYFDSTWELAYYIFCKEHDINITRCNEKFEYINVDGNKRMYHPDFRVNGKLTEIKGYYTLNVDQKLKAVNEPIDIFYFNDLEEIFKFVEKITNLKVKELYKLFWRP